MRLSVDWCNMACKKKPQQPAKHPSNKRINEMHFGPKSLEILGSYNSTLKSSFVKFTCSLACLQSKPKSGRLVLNHFTLD